LQVKVIIPLKNVLSLRQKMTFFQNEHSINIQKTILMLLSNFF